MRIVITGMLVGFLSVAAMGQDLSPLRRIMDDSLTGIELLAVPNGTTPMSHKVVMRWSNNARGSETGITVLYLADGVPQAVCCVYPWEQSLIHEFDSLSRGRLVGKRDGAVVWTPESAGLSFQSVPEAEAPAENPAARLRQMKSLAAGFSSTMLGWRADRSDREELRLLPQPLYRYETTSGSIFDGAVFAFVQGTDPESLLLIEAVKDAQPARWEYAFVRRTSGELEGRHKGVVVWHADQQPQTKNPRSTHFSLGQPLDAAVLESLRTKDE
ncbi:MAG TPA: hypothetical protein VM165_06810 [Planctomycetaceae bacterium]|nr:hypothetical protein [Planctomycetaceae bacterium]